MKRSIIFCMVLFMAAAAFAQTPSGGTFRARIVDWASGLPVVDATVSLYRDNQTVIIRKSDDNGQVTFENVPPGRHGLRVAAKGYGIKDGVPSIAGSDSRTLDIGPASDIELRVEMVPSGTIGGTVRDAADHPLPDKRVVALQKQFSAFGDSVLNSVNSSAQTNAKGEYVLSGLAFGEYFVKVEGQPSVYYPGTTDARDVSPIVLAASAPAAIGIDVRRTVDTFVKISGSIVNVEQPQSDVAIDALYLVSTASEGVADVRTLNNRVVDRAGHFEIADVAPGEYDIVATLLLKGRRFFGRTHVDVHLSEIDGIKLHVYPSADLVGRVSVRSGSPLPDLSTMHVLLLPRRNSIRGLASGTSRIDGEGNIRIQSVLPDEYRIRVTAPPGYYLESVTLDNVDVRDRPAAINPAASTLEITLASPAASVAGKAVTEQGNLPWEPMLVLLIPFQSNTEYPALSITVGMTQFGNFNFPNVAPGRYRLLAFQTIPSGFPFYNPQFLQQHLSRATIIEVKGAIPVVANTVAIPVRQ